MDLFNAGLAAVEPVSTPAPWVGGKRKLAKRIGALIAAIPHELYAEPFLGMGGVFLKRTRKPPVEAVNDINADVATLFRILQRHYASFISELKFTLSSRAEFERLTRADPATLTDIERSARFLYLQRLAYGGKVTNRAFGVSSGAPARFNLTTLEPTLAALHDRLAGVTIERLPWAEFVAAYDRAGALFYCDPPYWGSEGEYGAGIFARAEFERLAAAFRATQGAAIVSLNDLADVRAIFKGYAAIEAEVVYAVQGGEGVQARELIMLNALAAAAARRAGYGLIEL